jgi:hypothetical protein
MVFRLLCVFSVAASAVVRGFCSYWPGPDWDFLSPHGSGGMGGGLGV